MLLNTEKAVNFTIMENHLTELNDAREEHKKMKMGHGIIQTARSADELRRVVFLKDSLHFHYLPYLCFQSSSSCEFGKRCALSHNQA